MLTAEAIITGGGVAVGLGGGAVAWALARTVPPGRIHWALELALALVTALLLGLVATALDFGGWAVADWRAGLFAFLGAAAALGCLRSVTLFARHPLK